jgi:hypothetical protein
MKPVPPMMKTDISPSPVLSLHHTPFGAPLGVVWCTIGTVAIVILCAGITGWHPQWQLRARGKNRIVWNKVRMVKIRTPASESRVLATDQSGSRSTPHKHR